MHVTPNEHNHKRGSRRLAEKRTINAGCEARSKYAKSIVKAYPPQPTTVLCLFLRSSQTAISVY